MQKFKGIVFKYEPVPSSLLSPPPPPVPGLISYLWSQNWKISKEILEPSIHHERGTDTSTG